MQVIFHKLFFCTVILLAQFGTLRASDNLSVNRLVINSIIITGNKKTKQIVILRELGFKAGDTTTAEQLPRILKLAERQLINTSLFLTAEVKASNTDSTNITINIIVKERWYVFPAPVFSLADQNFNVWWTQQMRQLDRINYGMSVDYNNFTGHNDHLSIGFQTGYNRAWGIFYNRPNIGKKQQHEFGIQAMRGKTREVNYASFNDKKVFIKQPGFIKSYSHNKIYYSYRQNLFLRHYFSVGIKAEKVADTVAKLNPNYFGRGKKNILYSEFVYRFSYNKTNNIQYPLTGKTFFAELVRCGISKNDGLNLTQLKMETALFLKLFHKTYFNTQLSTKIILPKTQPFIRAGVLGYNDKELIRGLDQFIFDGNAYTVIRTNLKRELLNTGIHLKPLPAAFKKMPIKVFAKILFDAGYINNHLPGNNRLVNRYLYTYGTGIDLVSYYDINVTFEYTINQWHLNGFFFRVKFGL